MDSIEQGWIGTFSKGAVLLGLLSGCGSSAPAPQSEAGTSAAAPATPDKLNVSSGDPVAMASAASTPASEIVQTSAQTKDAEEEDVFALGDDHDVAPLPGSPQQLLREMAKLRTAPADVVRQAVPGAAGKFEEVKLTPEQIKSEKSLRWHSIINKAMQVIVATTNDPKSESLFNNAVHYLCDSRVELALAGEVDQAELLNQDAEALYRRNKDSFAAAESAYKLLTYSQSLAEQSQAANGERSLHFSRMARLFAERFPKEINRAASALLSAGRACEAVGNTSEARICYELVATKYATTPYADQVTSIVRRLKLPGTRLEAFGGPTLDGGFIKLEDYANRPVLVVFWSKDSGAFQSDIATLKAAEKRFAAKGLTIIGVNLDQDELALEKYLDQQGITWRQIFHSTPNERGLRNPVAAHYGVTQLPTYWLIAPGGKVVAAPLALNQLEAALKN